MRVFLEFQRKAKVVEKGGVAVEVGDAASIADVYRRAHKGEFAEFLTSNRDYSDEEWEFKIMEEKDDA